ncbi:MAG: hypothetical protein LUD25_01810 [Coriobacteriaceae bacterium]|nr:hypothetical protein [Coriobacteriaceae bacterium]
MAAVRHPEDRSSPRRLAGTYLLTRRQACLLAFGGASTLALSGCGGGTFGVDADTREGFGGTYTEVKSYPVSLKFYVDKNLKYHGGDDTDPQYAAKTSLEMHFKHYQAQQDRSDVSFDIEWIDMYEMHELAQNGFPDGDAIIALDQTVGVGLDSGACNGLDGGYLYYDEGSHWNERSVMVRAKGSKAHLPKAVTLDGEDSADGTYNRLQQLPVFKGKVAVADPYHSVEARCANIVLHEATFGSGLYHYPDNLAPEGWKGCGGEYAASIADKIVVYPTQKEAMQAVASGECDLGFSTQVLASRFSKVEICYEPPLGQQFSYWGAALSNSEYPGVVWDFFSLLSQTSW